MVTRLLAYAALRHQPDRYVYICRGVAAVSGCRSGGVLHSGAAGNGDRSVGRTASRVRLRADRHLSGGRTFSEEYFGRGRRAYRRIAERCEIRPHLR